MPNPAHAPDRRFNYSNVMSTLAVFLVIAGGTALAAALPKNSVKSKQVKDNSLKSKDLKDGKAVGGADVIAQQVQLRVGESCPEGQAIRVINIQGGVVCEVDDLGASGGPPSGAAGGGLAGTYPSPTIADNAVNSAKVADGSLTGSDVADNTLGGADVDESSLGQVPSASNADEFAGLGVSSFHRRCDGGGGPYRAIYKVDAATDFPSSYTSDPARVQMGDGNCSAGLVRRVAEGQYYIRRFFDERFLVGNVMDTAQDDFVVWDTATDGSFNVFRVFIRDADGGTQDTDFVVAVFE